MAGPYYDEFGRQVIFNNNVRPGRYRPPPPPQPEPVERSYYHYQEDGYLYQPQPEPQRHHRSSSTSERPQQIIINNENFVDERPPPQEYRRPPPRETSEQRVYVQEQQIVKVRSKSPGELSYETRRALEELERLKRDKDHEELVKRMEEEFKLKEAKAHEEELERKEKEKKLKEKAVEEWQAAEEKKKREAEEKEKEREKIGKEYMRQQLRKDGYTEEEIEAMMAKKDKKRAPSPAVSSTSIVIANRPTYLKVHKSHIDPRTLEHFKLKWEWADDEYIHILEWIPESDQEILFEHTRNLHKEKKLIKFAEVETVVTKEVKKDRHGRLLMVRKKDGGRARSKSPVVTKRFYVDG